MARGTTARAYAALHYLTRLLALACVREVSSWVQRSILVRELLFLLRRIASELPDLRRVVHSEAVEVINSLAQLV